MKMINMKCALFIGTLLLVALSVLQAENPSQDMAMVNALSSSSLSDLTSTLTKIAKTGDDRYESILENFRSGSLFRFKENVYLHLGTYENDDLDEFVQGADVFSGEPLIVGGLSLGELKASLIPIEDIEMIDPGRKIRKLIAKSKMILSLSSNDRDQRLAAVKKTAFANEAIELLPELEEIQHNDADSKIRWTAQESYHIIAFREGSPQQREMAIDHLGELQSLRSSYMLSSSLKNDTWSDEETTKLREALASIHWHESCVVAFDLLKSGLSSGSILILMALGLSITFGMMGIINMAHGELMMVGAYTTYCVQLLFGHTSSDPNNMYFFVALPASFLVSMIMGAIIETTVVRKLYQYPLESLLATYGIGLIMIQITRIIFGDNCPSNSPTWLQGGVEIFNDMILQYNRIFIFMLTLCCLAFVLFLFKKTSLGLKMKASMQNRSMASAMGINTRQVDLFTFMLGSGMAGIAGNALITVGGITPDMGQNYIVDSFLVVVTGGVGNVFGVVCSGMGLGVMTKTLESLFFGAVWSKIIVLLMVIVFIQFRPSGIFALKGRHADD
jgi:urea transport system permease protein